MSLRAVCIILLSAAFTLFGACALTGEGIDYLGLRVALPMGDLPLLIGVDLGTKAPFGWGIVSLLLTPDGKTLILGSLEYTLGEGEEPGASMLCLSAGISYFDLRATFPSPLFGGGFAYEFLSSDGMRAGFSGQILYPFALRSPFFTLWGGWSP